MVLRPSLSAVTVEIEDLGRRAYAPVLERMRALHASVAAGCEPGRILVVEHESVFTAGRATPPQDLRPDIVAIERGGKVTWHGPGQLVVYPIVPLPRRDVLDWLRQLESFGVAICGAFGLRATPSVDGTGVFVGTHKVASIGVAIRRWTNLHGIAINVDVAKDSWQRIRPCGRDPSTMSDLATACGRKVTLEDVRSELRRHVHTLLAVDAVAATAAGGGPR